MQSVKQPISINFQQGLKLKPDPYQVPTGGFLRLVNSVFDKVGRLTKRFGMGFFTTLPDNTTTYLTTYNNNLQAIGANLLSYSAGQKSWLNKGSTYPVSVGTIPLVRNALEQTQATCAVSPNALTCTAYTETNGSTQQFKYIISNNDTQQNVIAPVAISGAVAVYGTPVVFTLGTYFVILYTAHPSNYTLNYIAVSYLNPLATPFTGVIASNYTPASTLAFDAATYNNSLYICYTGSGSTGMHFVSLNSLLTLSSTFVIDAAHKGTLVSVCVDAPNQLVWCSYYDSATTNAYTVALTPNGITRLSATQIVASTSTVNLTAIASNSILTFFYEVATTYPYDSSIPSHNIDTKTCSLSGTVSSGIVSIRSMGLASKPFEVGGVLYYLGAYQSPYQPTYFLVNASVSSEHAPTPIAKLAYSNGGGYLVTGLPSATVSGTTVTIPYRFKDLLEAQAPAAAASINLASPAVYTQTGVNLVSFDFTTDGISSTEIGQTLNLTGGFLWSYDGFKPVENGFLIWPDSIKAVGSSTSGSMIAQQYYYQVCYEWTNNRGLLERSAPSIPVTVTLTSDTSVDISIPTLRLTYKIASPIRIVIYRWSAANQTYYQVTSITQPLQNDPLSDSVTYNDGLADTAIIGNNIIYSTGGVIEDIGGPAARIQALFDDRLWLVTSEDPNLLWFSKQLIEGTPVELSDALTYYVAPSTGAEGSTGDITAIYPMDDKLIVFKANAIYYINGTGPDNTGSNSQYSQPIFINGTVGCSKPRSIITIPTGLIFQSNKGIWLLGRDLSTSYIGADVEDFNSFTVTSALSIPGTNQVRLTLSNGSSLMYDYFVQQWGEFQGSSSISSCLYNSLQTTVDQFGTIYQETPDKYLDGSSPVLMSFQTSWLNVAGLRGYLRAYWFYLLGTYLSPHKLNLSIAYDYNDSETQSDLIPPLNYAPAYGNDPFYGGNGTAPYGGVSLENWRVFLERQRCKSFRITMSEVFDPSFGTVAGPGLTLSGLSCIVALKKSYAPINSNQQIG